MQPWVTFSSDWRYGFYFSEGNDVLCCNEKKNHIVWFMQLIGLDVLAAPCVYNGYNWLYSKFERQVVLVLAGSCWLPQLDLRRCHFLCLDHCCSFCDVVNSYSSFRWLFRSPASGTPSQTLLTKSPSPIFTLCEWSLHCNKYIWWLLDWCLCLLLNWHFHESQDPYALTHCCTLNIKHSLHLTVEKQEPL